jgi:hypothetical protein
MGCAESKQSKKERQEEQIRRAKQFTANHQRSMDTTYLLHMKGRENETPEIQECIQRAKKRIETIESPFYPVFHS